MFREGAEGAEKGGGGGREGRGGGREGGREGRYAGARAGASGRGLGCPGSYALSPLACLPACLPPRRVPRAAAPFSNAACGGLRDPLTCKVSRRIGRTSFHLRGRWGDGDARQAQMHGIALRTNLPSDEKSTNLRVLSAQDLNVQLPCKGVVHAIHQQPAHEFQRRDARVTHCHQCCENTSTRDQCPSSC